MHIIIIITGVTVVRKRLKDWGHWGWRGGVSRHPFSPSSTEKSACQFERPKLKLPLTWKPINTQGFTAVYSVQCKNISSAQAAYLLSSLW